MDRDGPVSRRRNQEGVLLDKDEGSDVPVMCLSHALVVPVVLHLGVVHVVVHLGCVGSGVQCRSVSREVDVDSLLWLYPGK